MKKVLILLVVIALFGCSKSEEDILSDFGYTQKEIEIIETFSEEQKQIFLSEYNSSYADLLNVEDFDIENLDLYMKYYQQLDNNKLVECINNDLNIETIIELSNDEYYIEDYEDIYLEYVDSYNSIRKCIEAVNTKSYLDCYTNVIDTDTSKDYLMLINKYNKLSSDYEPEDLVEIEANYGSGYTRKEVYEQYKKLQDDANELGYDFWICSAYRSYGTQDALYNKYLIADEGGQESVDTYSARPGHSEHQSGLCLDLCDAQYGMDDFGLSEASAWLNENCYKYGFIIRYTEEKEKVTGYQAEPWQIRYVGSPEIAKDILDRNITFDEYYAFFIER